MPKKATPDLVWTLASELKLIEKIATGYPNMYGEQQQSRINILKSKNDWLKGYLSGLSKRYYSFMGRKMEPWERRKLMVKAMTLMEDK